jgi:hypothetical protein
MTQIEYNIIHSFQRAKRDIAETQQTVLSLGEAQHEIMRTLMDLRMLHEELQQKVASLAPKKDRLVRSQNGKKYHIERCPYAQNIKHKISIDKSDILKKFMVPCRCVK